MTNEATNPGYDCKGEFYIGSIITYFFFKLRSLKWGAFPTGYEPSLWELVFAGVFGPLHLITSHSWNLCNKPPNNSPALLLRKFLSKMSWDIPKARRESRFQNLSTLFTFSLLSFQKYLGSMGERQPLSGGKKVPMTHMPDKRSSISQVLYWNDGGSYKMF